MTVAGYKPQRKLYKLKFADEEYEGLEVTATGTSMATVLEIQELSEKLSDQPTAAEAATLSRKIIEIFHQALQEWNLVDEDEQPLPTDIEVLTSQDPDFVMALVQAWTQAVSGVSAPLAVGSSSGEMSLEASLPMETLSPSQAS